ncbi:hypothetical protein HYH03_017406 [Edaphochlamys debaryana]|uniref:Uncharacterized protein n=1 Tax=Edaphochlamys debaryana TaxID=47281 RepID=A0A835XHA7_9CHLO|nr:hypothetical protein HYH03_017406 [Edaphochlamys debaryana]|eukprot:KAG2483751.1 hypothetical protein HYH03_017406 [Edaphochlamys debaryana]
MEEASALLAKASGTPDDVLERAQGHDFLVKCLRKAKFNADLLQDTVDACEINDLNAVVLGSGLLSVTEASEKLFLMQDEAQTVVTVCRKECLRIGVNFGDGAALTPEELAEPDDVEEVPAAPAPPPPPPPKPVATPPPPRVPSNAGLAISAQEPALQRQPSQPSPSAATTPAPAVPEPTPSAAPAPVPSASVATPPAATEASRASVESHPDPNFLIKPPVAAAAAASTPAPASTPAAPTPHGRHGHIPRPSASAGGAITTPAASATPRDRGAAKPMGRGTPSMSTPATSQSMGGAIPSGLTNGKHTPTAFTPATTGTRPPRPTTAPLSARGAPSSTTMSATKERPASAMPTPSAAPAAKLPSYARPTAAHKAKLLKEEADAVSTSGSGTPATPVTFASTNKPLRRFLYMPPRPVGGTPEEKEKKEPKKPVFDNIRSSLLRPTQAFLAWTAGKGKGNTGKEPDLKTSQTLQGTQSEAGAPRPTRSVVAKPSGVRSEAGAPPPAGSPGGGDSKTTTPQPFKLSSMERHAKAQEELQRKIAEKAAQEANIPKFKASPMPAVGTAAKRPTTASGAQDS